MYLPIAFNTFFCAQFFSQPILTHIVKTTPEADPRTFCGLVLQAAGDPNICVIRDSRFEWQVDLPEPTTVETVSTYAYHNMQARAITLFFTN